ncbi:unnamed protein product, partial [Medioppia subpectinata]
AYSCRYSDDVILVYDGKDSQSPLIAQLCNRETFVQIISSGPDLYIQFKTGSAQPIYNGFKASYLFESNQTNLHLMSSQSTTTISPIKIENIQIPQMEPVEDLLHKDETTESSRKFLRGFGLSIAGEPIRGGFSRVYKANSRDSRPFAVKVVNVRQNDKQFVDQEMKISKEVNHPNIMRTYRTYRLYNRFAVMISDFADGGDLVGLLDSNLYLSERHIRALFSQIVSAVVYLHDIGVAHRDIKPDNVLIDRGVAKLCDFGYAYRPFDRFGRPVLCRKACGTLDYQSPEQFVCLLKGTAFDPFVSDCYSLGALLFMMTLRQFPFDCQHLNIDSNKQIRMHLKKQMQFSARLNRILRDNRDVLSILKQLMTPDVDIRIRSSQILCHPWFMKQI